MDAPETEGDVQLQRTSASLIKDFSESLYPFVYKIPDSNEIRLKRRVRIRDTDRLVALLEPFQELPQLLDPHLDHLVPPLAEWLTQYLRTPPPRHPVPNPDTKLLTTLSSALCRLLYTFCKIRGEKVIVRFFSTETRHLELLLSALEKDVNGQASDTVPPWDWEQRYIALLWLSQLLLAPFDLSTISSGTTEEISTSSVPGLVWPPMTPGVAVRVIPLAIGCLAAPGKEKDAARVLLVRVAMRRDMQQLGILSALVNWAMSRLQSVAEEDHSTHGYIGVLSFLAGLLAASVTTTDMDRYLATIFNIVQSIANAEEPILKAIYASAVARKIIIKILRTITILLLRQLESAENVEIIQTAIGYMLESLSDLATPVRLAASKALSMIVLKLEPEMAPQVVDAVLDTLQTNVLRGDISRVNPLEWHGVILTLSHLLYRRSIPTSDDSLMLNVLDALRVGLSFQQRSTTGSSIGTNVRDAACFGIWALARRYTTKELENWRMIPLDSTDQSITESSLQTLATELVVSASLDPAGNIRRGSSAALQELIGRHPDTIAEGIAVVQVVDYHAVALRARAVREVALQAAPLSNYYYHGLLLGLLGWRGLMDTDAAARRNAATAIGEMVWAKKSRSLRPWTHFRFAIDLIVARLKSLASREVEARHGLLLALASILGKFSADCTRTSISQEFAALYRALAPTFPPKLDPNITAKESPLIDTIREIVTMVKWILSDANNKTKSSRRPELLAEAISLLLSSAYHILRADCIIREYAAVRGQKDTFRNVLKMNLLCLPSFMVNPEKQRLVRSLQDIDRTYDSDYTPNEDCLQDATALLGEFLRLPEASSLDAVSNAAADLLLIVHQYQRTSLISEWISNTVYVPKSSSNMANIGYVCTLLKVFPPKGQFQRALPWEDEIVTAIRKRWDVDRSIETRVAIMQCLTTSHALHTHTRDIIGMIKEGMDDYTTNARGDIGSLLRVEAVKAAGEIWSRTTTADNKQTEEVFHTLLGSALRLASEKLDRVRIEGQRAISNVLVDSTSFEMLLSSSKEYFSYLLDLEGQNKSLKCGSWDGEWSLDLLEGIISSADTGSEELVRASRASLILFCDENTNVQKLGADLLQLLENNLGVDRISVPVLEAMAFLLDVRILQQCNLDWARVYFLVQKSHFKSGNVRKIEAAVKVYGGLIEVFPRAAEKLSSMLIHQYPKIRNLVAEELWVRGENGYASLEGIDWTKGRKEDITRVKKELGISV